MINPEDILQKIRNLADEHLRKEDENTESGLVEQIKIWVAYSGGLDSSVLLHILASSNFKLQVGAIHVNHQLSPNASDWQRHCEGVCANYGVECLSKVVSVQDSGGGIEEAARLARYRIFEEYVRRGDLLLMAHHRDDQIETLLFRLCRGSGLKGLSGIKVARELIAGSEDGQSQNAKMFRPLLNYSKNDLLQYANNHGLTWVDDESNESERFDRNYLRHSVVPLLEQRWPGVSGRLNTSIQLLSDADQLLDEYAYEDLIACDLKSERLGESLSLKVFKHYSLRRQNHIIRTWVSRCGFSLPDRAQLAELKSVTAAREDAKPQLKWGACSIRRFKNRLYLLPDLTTIKSKEYKVDLEQVLHFSDGSSITFLPAKKGLLSDRTYSVKFRQGGERCQPVGRSKSQTIKKLMQEYAVEPWLRDRVPLIYYKDSIAAVGDLWLCEGPWLNKEKTSSEKKLEKKSEQKPGIFSSQKYLPQWHLISKS